MTEACRYEVADGVATLTLDRAQYRNALSAELMDSLGDALSRAASDRSCRLVVLTNKGPVFSAGADLRPGSRPGRFRLFQILSALYEFEKPVVARIAGDCYGGGVGLAAACDLSVAARETTFGFTEVRLGVAPAVISVVCLDKMRRGDALELFLTGARFDAERAVDVGLITRAVERDELDGAVRDLTRALLAGAPGALRAAKRLVRDVPGMPRNEAFLHTTELSEDLFSSDEAAEGRAAFAEHRLPLWARDDTVET